MTKRPVVRVVVSAVVAILLGSGVGLAQSGNCGREGTWFGEGDSGITWMATDTRGANATVGQFDIEWVSIDPTLGNFFPTSVRVTGAKGVWKKVTQRKYKYTWVAYGVAADNSLVVVARASGFAILAGCNRANLTYTLEFFDPAQNIWTDQPGFTATGTAVEKRMPLVVVH